jgi:hypothetical protein
MKFKTNEDAIRFAIAKVVEQGCPSYDAVSDKCLYRGPNGTRCAIGWLIPDDRFDHDTMEGKDVSFDAVKEALSGVLPDTEDERLVNLQYAHDVVSETPRRLFIEEFRRALEDRNLGMFWPAGT